MWYLLAGIVLAVVGATGIWYTVRNSAIASQDRDVALEEKKLAEERATAINDKMLKDEAAIRKEEVSEKPTTAVDAAAWLRTSGRH